MSSDVRQLFESIGLPHTSYREIALAEHRAATAAAWLARVASGSASVEFEATPAPPRPHDPARPFTVAITSLVARTGRTSVAANLADLLAQENHRAAAVDLDPANALLKLFGPEAATTRASVLSTDRASLHGLFEASRFRLGASCLPFGGCPREELARFEDTLEKDPQWLAKRLRMLTDEECELVILDTPAGSSPWSKQALLSADEIVVVLVPDEQTYPTLVETEAWLNAHGLRGQAAYLVNRFDGRRSSDRETVTALRGLLGERVLPFVVQADIAVEEAGAQGVLLLQRAPDSQAVADLGVLAEWVLARRKRALSQPLQPQH